LRISLAAKCQLLFGAAVVLIIAAALLVPWQRMEQLMEKINERAAGAMADAVLDEHVLEQTAQIEGKSNIGGIGRRSSTQPAVVDGKAFWPPQLLGVKDEERFTRIEKMAVKALEQRTDLPFWSHRYDAKDGTQRYAYVRPVYGMRASCLKCHGDEGSGFRVQRSGKQSATAPSSAPVAASAPKLMGIVSVDIESQIQTNQLLLNRVFLLLAGLLTGSLATGVFYVITSRLVLRPVRVLQDTAEKVSEGDLNIRCDISSGDEFQQLSETINHMLGNLKEGEDQLRSINKGLDLKLGQMAEANVALYESNRLKSEFLANVSHELRTPLNSILGFAELLRESAGGGLEGKTARYVQNILTSGRNLLELINDLLDLAKIEAGRMEVRSEPLSLSDLFEGLISILKPLTEPKKLAIDATVAADMPILHTDPAKLQQVLYNFLSNAIKFSPEGGKIELTAARENGEHVRISVSDQGPGIHVSQHEVIFEKFRQIDASVTREHSGTGLGLAISKELTALLGGAIGVQSEVGKGATFFVTLPMKIQAGSQDVKAGMVLA